MYNDENKILNDDALKAVSGGVSDTQEFEKRRDEFEKAWKKGKMDSKGYSGMAKAELFDKWEGTGYKQDAADFLLDK